MTRDGRVIHEGKMTDEVTIISTLAAAADVRGFKMIPSKCVLIAGAEDQTKIFFKVQSGIRVIETYRQHEPLIK